MKKSQAYYQLKDYQKGIENRIGETANIVPHPLQNGQFLPLHVRNVREPHSLLLQQFDPRMNVFDWDLFSIG